MPEVLNQEGHVWHLFVVQTQYRDELQQYLLENGVQTLIHYPIPPHKQKALIRYKTLNLPITEAIHNTVISIPISPVMPQTDAEKIVDKEEIWRNLLLCPGGGGNKNSKLSR